MQSISKSGTLLVLLLSVTTTLVAADEFTHKIINGEQVTSGAWPSTVALVNTENNNLFQRQFCAGTMISDRWVLTAAHCLFAEKSLGSLSIQDPVDIRIAVGVTDLSDEQSAMEVEIKAFEVHPFYDPEEPRGYYDIAVIELQEAVSVPAIDLFEGDLEEHSGSSAIVVGWGATAYPNPGSSDFPFILNQLTVPLVSREVCNLPASYDGILMEGQFCAGYSAGGADSCVGDSGGPIMMLQGSSYKQIGVVSFGDGCAQPDKYGVYADVPYFSTWIEQYVNGSVTAMNGSGGIRPPNGAGGGKDLLETSSGSGSVGFLWLSLIALLAAFQTPVSSATNYPEILISLDQSAYAGCLCL